MHSLLLRSLSVACVAVSLVAISASAQTYVEAGDAGQTLATAQSTGVFGTSLTAITGTLASGTDADLFLINITAPTMFSASTVNIFTSLDTALFLFNSSGMAIFTNDDASGTSVQSALSAGSSFMAMLNPGIYYLGISLSGNEPINLNGQLLFAAFPGGDSTALRGAASGVNPDTLGNFNGQTYFPKSGAYQINLTSTAAVPEPSSLALSAAGAAALAFVIRRRRKARSAVA